MSRAPNRHLAGWTVDGSEEIGEAHQVMRESCHSDQNMAALASVPAEGLTDLPGSHPG